MKKFLGRLSRFFKSYQWQDIEYFNPEWKARIKLMSDFIQDEKLILDLGCGKMWLKEFIQKDVKYYPVDYINRGDETIICDFNNYQFPDIKADITFISGCLEYILDYEWFINSIESDKCIISYCTVNNFPDRNDRKKKVWKNNLSEEEIINLFNSNNYKLTAKTTTLNTIFVFEKDYDN